MHLKRQLCIFFCDFGIFLEFLFFMWTQRMLTPAHPKYSFFPLFCFQNRGSGGQNVTQPPETGLYMTRTLQTHFLVILWRFWAFLEWFWWIFHVDATHANACPPKILICSDSRGVWWGWKNGKITKKIDTDPLKTLQWLPHTHRNRPGYRREIFSMVNLWELQKITYYEKCTWLEKHLQLYGNPY